MNKNKRKLPLRAAWKKWSGVIAVLILNLGNRWGECSSSRFIRLTLWKGSLVVTAEEEDVGAPQVIWTLCRWAQFLIPAENRIAFPRTSRL